MQKKFIIITGRSGCGKGTQSEMLESYLKKIYEQTADTSLFQNEVFNALARHKTKAAYSLFKELILQDPPIFESDYEYSSLFENLKDSLLLARSLFPELLQLSSYLSRRIKWLILWSPYLLLPILLKQN